MCILEINTRFPENDKNLLNEKILNTMLDKMIIFEQFFSSLGVKYNRIRLILFYDLVKETNYIHVIKSVLKKFGMRHKYLNYLNKIYIQVIYINSSYSIESLIAFRDEIKNLKETIKILGQKDDEIKKLNKKIIQL